MNVKNNIRKMIWLALGVLCSAGLLVLLVAAINKKNHQTCSGTEIIIKGEGSDLFLNRQDIEKIIAPNNEESLKGKTLASFDLKKMEAALKQNVYVRTVQLYFDNNAVLRIQIEERAPVARIFSVAGNSFYIDSSGKQLPLNSKFMAKLPVFTNCPLITASPRGADSLLLQQIKQIAVFINNDPFWLAQIGQIDITSNRFFELWPVLGNHMVVFGDGTNYEQKFHRLFLFYNQVSANAGLDKYRVINVEFDNQVVAVKKGTVAKADSLQAIKNIQQLIESSKQLADDTVSTLVDNNIGVNAAAVSTLTILKDRRQNAAATDSFARIPPVVRPKPIKTHAYIPPVKKPKAVMPKPSN